MLITVGDSTRLFARKGIPCIPNKFRQYSSFKSAGEALDFAEKKIAGITSKDELTRIYDEHPLPYVRSLAVKRLGEVCFGTGKGANACDYAVFAKAIFQDASFMPGEEAVKALAKAKAQTAIALLVQATGCGMAHIRMEAQKALDMLLLEERSADSGFFPLRMEPEDAHKAIGREMTAEEKALQMSLQKGTAQFGWESGRGSKLPTSKMIEQARKTIDRETLYLVDIQARKEEEHAGAGEMD